MFNRFYDKYWKNGLHPGNEWSPKYFDKVMGTLKGQKCVLDYGSGLGLNYQKILVANVQKYDPRRH